MPSLLRRKEHPLGFPSRHRRLAGLLAAGVLAFLASGVQAAPPVRVALLPVVVHSLEQQAYLREGVGDMLATRLARDARLVIVPITDPEQATTDPAAALQSAREVGARWAVFGSFTRFGEGASLDLKCADTENEVVAGDRRSIFVQSGTLGEIIPRLDELSEKIAQHITTGATMPDVAAGPPGAAPRAEANGSGSAEVEDLAQRVKALEDVIFGGPAVPEESLGGGEEAAPEF